VKKNRRCLICEAPVEPFMSFGKMPIANGFLSPDQFAEEYFFELQVGWCSQCGMVQLTELVDRDRMFHANYAFFSSTSSNMQAHFRDFAQWVSAGYLQGPDAFVVEIGSNDGIMLRHFAAAGINHLGIEPSTNVAAVARERGVHTISEFFDADLAKRIVAEYGQADAFLGANVMCHIPYLHSVADGIRILLKPAGVLAFEDPYLGDIVEKTSYDQIYDEHAFYFSLASVSHLFGQHGLEVIDVEPQNVHGGSMRYVITHKGARAPSPRVSALQAREAALGLRDLKTFVALRGRIERSRDALRSLLQDLRMQGKRVVGYGATSKSTTVTNYCGITPELVEYISDTTPIKQGKFSPGAHLPVRPYEEFVRRAPDYALLFAWNHSAEIFERERAFTRAGGRWISYVPNVQVS
jgi:methylation protein EvaC